MEISSAQLLDLTVRRNIIGGHRPITCLKHLLFLALFVLSLTTSQNVFGQIDFNPEDPEVEAIATRGIEFLTNNMPGDPGEAVLAGIACIEYTKRYSNYVDVEHPLVQNALAKANNGMRADPPIKDSPAIYIPALAVILYCECGDQLYQEQIQELVNRIVERQGGEGGFGYLGQANIGDTSQTQYAALALWVAKAHGYDVPPEIGKKTLEWLCRSQSNAGSWFYHARNFQAFGGDREHRHSIHCSGLSTVYLLADYLQLVRSRTKGAKQNMNGLQLPPSVSIHVKPKNGQERKVGPLIGFDKGLLTSTSRAGNSWLKSNWTVNSAKWNYYYLYALERYAHFREKTEGRLPEFPTWYDEGVRHLMGQQDASSGGWGGGGGEATADVNTSLAVMFLVRASQVLVLEGNTGTLTGNKGFESNKKLVFDKGKVRSQEAIKGVQDVMTLLSESDPDDDLETILETLAPAISQMASRDNKSRNEQMAFMRGLVGDKNPDRRRIAVRLLAGVQSIENAPALIYALGDPVLGICEEAHNGLRLVSRKIDTIEISANPTRAEFDALKKKWTDWYLTVNPGAQLLD